MTLLKDRGFYIILSLSLVVVAFAAFIAISWDDSPEVSDDEILYLDPLDPQYVPDWPEEDLSENVSLSQNEEYADTADDFNEQPADSEPEPVIFYMPVNVEDVISVNDFSGTMPVFSETLEDWRLHQGVDYITDEPCDVFAAADGVVEDIYDDGFMGTSVIILHSDGTRTVYRSLSPNVKVVKDMKVFAGDVIGKTGTSAENELAEGCHLHFEMIKDGALTEPVFG